MATLKPSYDYFKADGTSAVSIRLTHKRVIRYIPTEIYITKNQTRKGVIVDEHVIDDLNDLLKKYRQKIRDLSVTVNSYSCDDLKEYLTRIQVVNVDFIAWSKSLLEEIKVKGTRENGLQY